MGPNMLNYQAFSWGWPPPIWGVLRTFSYPKMLWGERTNLRPPKGPPRGALRMVLPPLASFVGGQPPQ